MPAPKLISAHQREEIRALIVHCKKLNGHSEYKEASKFLGEHLETLLNEVERLEVNFDRLAEEYVREKWQMLDEIRRLKQRLNSQYVSAAARPKTKIKRTHIDNRHGTS